MHKEKNVNTVVWSAVVLIFIVVLVLANNKYKMSDSLQEEVGQNTNMENTQNVEGVKIIVNKEGMGGVAKAGDTVSMNYTGKFMDGTAFDSNIDPKFGHVEPFEFKLGAGQVINGWDVGIVGMKVGEKRNLTIQPEYAYGANGYGPIPPNSTLVFDVELLAIKN